MVRQRPIRRSRAGRSTATHGGQAFRKRRMLRQRQSRGDCSDSFLALQPPVRCCCCLALKPGFCPHSPAAAAAAPGKGARGLRERLGPSGTWEMLGARFNSDGGSNMDAAGLWHALVPVGRDPEYERETPWLVPIRPTNTREYFPNCVTGAV